MSNYAKERKKRSFWFNKRERELQYRQPGSMGPKKEQRFKRLKKELKNETLD